MTKFGGDEATTGPVTMPLVDLLKASLGQSVRENEELKKKLAIAVEALEQLQDDVHTICATYDSILGKDHKEWVVETEIKEALEELGID